MTAHWGDLPVITDTDSGIAAIEREQLTKPRPMEVEGPRLHQPSSRHYPPTNDPLPGDGFQIDSITLHTIRLIQHAKKVRHLIHMVQQQQQEIMKTGEMEVTFPATPPIPEYTGPNIKRRVSMSVPFILKDTESAFVKGLGDPPPAIDDIACRKLLRRSVAAMCAHTGFDNSSESILETLTDITHEYFLRFSKHLRHAADKQALEGRAGFPDIIEQVFHEFGLGSVTTLHDFYQSRIINYHQNMQQTCEQLIAEYEKVKQPVVQKSPDNIPIIRIKEEPCSEIQFPELDEDNEVIEAEQLLNLEGLSGFEITVEHESASGLTTEVESRWQQGIKTEPQDTKDVKVSTLDTFDEPGSETREPPPQTPHQSEAGETSIPDPGSVPVSDIMSPPSITSRPSKPKKKKKS